MPVAGKGLDAGIPLHVSSHKSGGRDQWSPPRSTTPDDVEVAVRECLGEVLDPEIPISLVDLGLIYGVEADGSEVRIRMTFTATACPCMDFMKEDVRDRLLQEPWLDSVEIEEVWSPPWTVERITPEGREALQRLGVGVG